jgi:ABC-type sugar transport system permease subunit
MLWFTVFAVTFALALGLGLAALLLQPKQAEGR